jgi:hypothetical protein
MVGFTSEMGNYTGAVIFDGDRKMRIRDLKMEPVKRNSKIFNTAGISAISKTGWVNVVVRTKQDSDKDTTELIWLPYQNATQIILYAAEI